MKILRFYFNISSDDSWDDNDAKVVCRMMGFNATFARAMINGYGDVEDNFIMADVHCEGTEASLDDCEYATKDDCGTEEGAGVICYGK